jgi:hypothetical protein
MTVVKRTLEGWAWPRTILDYADFHEFRDQLDAIMNATHALLSARDLGVSIQSVPVYGGEHEMDELIFEACLTEAELQGGDELRSRWVQSLRNIVPFSVFYCQLFLLLSPQAPEEA